ncbi:MAG: hypothetical protein DRQ98_04895 [Gammaproteobacteria bacterium]|nr:MAG: hypothetical protein DRQ98_04895 [Gammaproteobacteria bacterium]
MGAISELAGNRGCVLFRKGALDAIYLFSFIHQVISPTLFCTIAMDQQAFSSCQEVHFKFEKLKWLSCIGCN